MLPPDVKDWLPADHLAWFVIDAVSEMDPSEFYAAYRADGRGRAAYEPMMMMVTLLMYAYSTKVRSSRAIESHYCRQDVAYRVITGNDVPDHATIARFVVRHERALTALLGQVLRLCDQAGLAKRGRHLRQQRDRGLIAIDGTRLAGNANSDATRPFEQIAREILVEARATDEREDETFGPERGDELPEELRTAEGQRAFLRKAKLPSQNAEERPSAGEDREAAEFDQVSAGNGSPRPIRTGAEFMLPSPARLVQRHEPYGEG